MALYNQDRIKKANHASKRFVELREFFTDSKSVAEPIRKLKEQKAACFNCKHMKPHPPHNLMFVCKRITERLENSVKFIKPYNLCADHSFKSSLNK